MTELFPRTEEKPRGWRAPDEGEHACRECQGAACYGLGDAWFCRAHVPPGFLPHLWGPRAEGPSICVRCEAVRGTPDGDQLCKGQA